MKYGRNYNKKPKYKFWKSVLILFIFMAVVVVVFRHVKIAQAATDQAGYLQLQLKSQQDQMQDLLEENVQLRNKIENANKVYADDKTAAIVRYYIKKYFGDKAPEAEKVFTCESHLRVNAVNINKPGLGKDIGVAQLNTVFQSGRFTKMTGLDLETYGFDPDMNIRVAKAIYDDRGNFSAWVCSKIVHVN